MTAFCFTNPDYRLIRVSSPLQLLQFSEGLLSSSNIRQYVASLS
jgi:hypothetical protein